MDIVDMLIANGAECRDSGLLIAAARGNLEMTNFLIQNGAYHFDYIFEMNDLTLYKRHLRTGGELDVARYRLLISLQDPLYFVVINHYCPANELIRKLPLDLWRMIKPFLNYTTPVNN